MASSNSYANINDIGNLRTLYNSFNTKLIDLEFADSPDAGKISKARDALAEIDERIVQLSALQDVGQSLPVVDRNLEKDIREQVSRIPSEKMTQVEEEMSDENSTELNDNDVMKRFNQELESVSPA